MGGLGATSYCNFLLETLAGSSVNFKVRLPISFAGCDKLVVLSANHAYLQTLY